MSTLAILLHWFKTSGVNSEGFQKKKINSLFMQSSVITSLDINVAPSFSFFLYFSFLVLLIFH